MSQDFCAAMNDDWRGSSNRPGRLRDLSPSQLRSKVRTDAGMLRICWQKATLYIRICCQHSQCVTVIVQSLTFFPQIMWHKCSAMLKLKVFEVLVSIDTYILCRIQFSRNMVCHNVWQFLLLFVQTLQYQPAVPKYLTRLPRKIFHNPPFAFKQVMMVSTRRSADTRNAYRIWHSGTYRNRNKVEAWHSSWRQNWQRMALVVTSPRVLSADN
jgi:hypothetical protein